MFGRVSLFGIFCRTKNQVKDLFEVCLMAEECREQICVQFSLPEYCLATSGRILDIVYIICIYI